MFIVFCGQSICYVPQLCSVKCLTETYCGITDTGAHTCLPCPAGNLCPGDGYTYLAPQLNKNYLESSNGSYIVNYDVRELKRFNKFKKIIKIAKVGLKVAAIAKTGGVAALKMAAAAKAKELLKKKGIQCLKNGLSNFCNGKKGLIKLKIKPKLGSIKKGATKLIKHFSKANKNVRGRQPVTKKIPVKPKRGSSKTNVKSKGKGKGKGKGNVNGKGKVNVKGKGKGKTGNVKKWSKKTKPRNQKQSVNTKRKPSNIPKSSGPVSVKCSNIFDTIADKVNNVTRHVANKAVNKGRDWLKKNVGGNNPNCVKIKMKGGLAKQHSKGGVAKQPTNLRGSKPSPISSNDDTPTNPVSDDSPSGEVISAPVSGPVSGPVPVPFKRVSKPIKQINPVNAEPSSEPMSIRNKVKPEKARFINSRKPVLKQPISGTDDTIPTTRPIRTRPLVKPVSDDAVPTTMPLRKRRVDKTRAPVSDDVVPTTIPLLTKRPIRERPIREKNAPLINDLIPTQIPIRTRVVRTTIPTGIPIVPPTKIPTVRPSLGPTSDPTVHPSLVPTMRPSRIPSVSPTRVPTVSPTTLPTLLPSTQPTKIPTNKPILATIQSPTMIPISWAVFSSAPVPATSFLPTLVPTFTMFTITTPNPTAHVSFKPSASPTLLRSVSLPIPLTNKPTLVPTLVPTALPTLVPSLVPTLIPTNIVILPTLSPTNANLDSSSINSVSESKNNGVSSGTIAAVIACVVVFIILISVCVYILNRKTTKSSPFERWTSHYSNKNQQTQQVPVVNDDIHHFYNRTPRPSISPNPVFTPHISANPSYRNSQMGGKLGSQRNSLRVSLPKRNQQQNYAL